MTDEYLPGLTKCGSSAAMFDLSHGDVLDIAVSVRAGEDKSEQMKLQSTLCNGQYGQNVQILLARPKSGNRAKGLVTVKKVSSNRIVSQFTFQEKSDTFQIPGLKKRKSESQQGDDGAGPSGVGGYTQPTAAGIFEKVIAGVSHKWEDLARKLGFSEKQIDGIHSSKIDQDRRCRKMLRRWRKMKGMEATLKVLKQALIDIDERLTAESFRLRRSGVPSTDLVSIFCGYIRPTREYAAPCWSSALTQKQSDALERVQKRACRIIPGRSVDNLHASAPGFPLPVVNSMVEIYEAPLGTSRCYTTSGIPALVKRRGRSAEEQVSLNISPLPRGSRRRLPTGADVTLKSGSERVSLSVNKFLTLKTQNQTAALCDKMKKLLVLGVGSSFIGMVLLVVGIATVGWLSVDLGFVKRESGLWQACTTRYGGTTSCAAYEGYDADKGKNGGGGSMIAAGVCGMIAAGVFILGSGGLSMASLYGYSFYLTWIQAVFTIGGGIAIIVAGGSATVQPGGEGTTTVQPANGGPATAQPV
ncbi:hypothetical protein Bbelb_334300 [Branchiostoma belcheri]|nr:hypothetical protein Bbelb_334300 [Branchiostoma belcheri]